jgi:hypothetical protein
MQVHWRMESIYAAPQKGWLVVRHSELGFGWHTLFSTFGFIKQLLINVMRVYAHAYHVLSLYNLYF